VPEKYESLVMYVMDWLATNLDGLIRLLDSALPILALLCVTYVVHVLSGRDAKLKKTGPK